MGRGRKLGVRWGVVEFVEFICVFLGGFLFIDVGMRLEIVNLREEF